MNDGLGMPQNVLVVGGGSEIARACVRRLVAARARRVALAGRQGHGLDSAADEVRRLGAEVFVIGWDATVAEGHAGMVKDAESALGEMDLALISVGTLGDQLADEADPAATSEAMTVNLVAPAAVGAALGGVIRRQGQGTIAVLSSVAGERVRRSNFTYGAAKAGLDAYFRGLGYALSEAGGKVIVVRPGFVRTRMTAGMKPAPLATTADAVAKTLVSALAGNRDVVWAPRALRWPMVAMRHLPEPLWRRVSSGM